MESRLWRDGVLSGENPLSRAPNWLNTLLVLIVLLFCTAPLVPLFSLDAMKVPYFLVGIAVLWRYAHVIRGSFPVWAILLVIVQLLFTWGLLLIDYPDIARSGPTLEDYLDKFGFLIVAIAVAASVNRVLMLYALLALLILAVPWTFGDGVADIQRGVAGAREGFGLNPIRTAIYLSLLCIGLISFREKIIGNAGLRRFRYCVWLLALAASLLMLLATQTRGVTMVLGLIFAVWAVYTLWLKRYWFQTRKKEVLLITGMVVIATITLAQSQSAHDLKERFLRDAPVAVKLVEGELEDMPNTGWGLRAQFWVVGIQWIVERPLAGWGYRAGRHVLSTEAEQYPQFSGYRQLHNSYLEMTVRYGIGGLIVIVALFVWTIYRTKVAYRNGLIPENLYGFFLSSLALFMGVACFYGLFFDDAYGLQLISVLLGAPLSFIYRDIQLQGLRGAEEAV